MDLDAILHDRGSPVATPTVRRTNEKRGRYTRPRTESQRRLLPRSFEDVDMTELGVNAPGSQGSSGGSSPFDYGSVSVTRISGVTSERSSISDRTPLIGVSSMPSLAEYHPQDTGSGSLALPRSGDRPDRTPSASTASDVAAPNGAGEEDVNQNASSSGDVPATRQRSVGFSRRKAHIAPAVRYLMEVVCTDLMACGECFVPDDGAGQTLVPFGSFVPIEVDEAVDAETARFMEEGYNEAYGRNVGLPGLAWASAKVRLNEISTLSSDPSFESGGDRLFQAARLFHSALSIPLYSAERLVLWGIGFGQLMGVVVVYFPGPENHASALIAYASTVAASASSVSELMVHRSLFVEGRAHRVKRNLRVMRIAIMFAVPMFAKYYRLTGKTVVDCVLDADKMESGSVIVAPRTNSAVNATTFRTPRHRLSIEKSLRRPLQQTAIPPGASAVLASREAAELKMSITGGGLKDWLYQYFAKVRGGPVHMPEPARPRDAILTWVGAFVGIGVADMVFNIMNRSFAWRGQEDLFVLSGSFGALSTLLYALPAVPLAQPRVVFSSHAMAIAASMMAISVFERGRLVWLQKALTVSSVILGMSLMGIMHPPAGALCLVFIGAYNKGSTDEQMEMLVVSVTLGLIIHVSVAILVNNLSPRRAYPVFW